LPLGGVLRLAPLWCHTPWWCLAPCPFVVFLRLGCVLLLLGGVMLLFFAVFVYSFVAFGILKFSLADCVDQEAHYFERSTHFSFTLHIVLQHRNSHVLA
jgi:hypothetical protein